MSEEPEIEIPSNLDEAVLALRKMMPSDTTAEWAAQSRQEATTVAHMGIGMWLRNNWGLWGGSVLREFFEKEFRLDHADDMSGLILDALWCDLNEKPRQTAARWAEFKAHWKERAAWGG